MSTFVKVLALLWDSSKDRLGIISIIHAFNGIPLIINHPPQDTTQDTHQFRNVRHVVAGQPRLQHRLPVPSLPLIAQQSGLRREKHEIWGEKPQTHILPPFPHHSVETSR